MEITPDQRDACLAASDRTDVNLMRQEAQNERQLRWALKLYWQTQKEDAARAAQPQGEAREADELLEALEQSVGSTVFDTKQSHQVVENTEELSGNGQNKAKPGDREKGETRKREALEKGLEQIAAAQQGLERQKRRLGVQVGESELAHAQVREQVKVAGVVVTTRREPTREEIIHKISEAIGLTGPTEFQSDTDLVESLNEEEKREFEQGRGPAWEELLRRRRARKEQEKRLGF